MQKRFAIDDCLKPYKFSLDGHLMINLGTEKRPKWFPTDDMEALRRLTNAAYEQGFEEANRIQRSKDILNNPQEYQAELCRREQN
jgi:hypothetical protein